MIYAMTKKDLSDADRRRIAAAIFNGDAMTIEAAVNNNEIIHINVFQTPTKPPKPLPFCIYCRDRVRSSRRNAPPDRRAAHPWHFQHTTVRDCIGEQRNPPMLNALGILNSSDQGCYVLLGCENVLSRHRTQCQTIKDGRTYCHLATQQHPPCMP